eukprot:7155317-Prymnesium_polylepis.1
MAAKDLMCCSAHAPTPGTGRPHNPTGVTRDHKAAGTFEQTRLMMALAYDNQNHSDVAKSTQRRYTMVLER